MVEGPTTPRTAPNDPRTTTSDEASGDRGSVQRLEARLHEWQTRIDDLNVQVALACMDVRDELTTHLATAENVYLAIRSRLSDTADDAGADVSGLPHAIDQLLVDLRRAYDDVEAVVRRSRRTP
jgi:hypothetical protein